MKLGVLNLGIQSYSDVITNSSSELFVAKKTENTFDKNKIQELINNHYTEHFWKGNYDDFKKLEEKEKLKWNTSSGCGGEHKVVDAHDRYLDWIKWHKNETCDVEDLKKDITYEKYLKYFDYRGEDYVYFDIDHSSYATINFILENFNVVENNEYGYYKIDPNTKRILKLITKEEWEKLPKEEQSEAW